MLRHAAQTWPLGLKNVEAKVLAASVASPLGRTLSTTLRSYQRGFSAGRHSLARARDLSLRSQSETDLHVDDAFLLAVDTSAAFPSLARPAIRAAVRHPLMHTGALHATVATMTATTFRLPGAATAQPRVRASRGVRQGCPLAGSLYILTTEPLARVMRSTAAAVVSMFI